MGIGIVANSLGSCDGSVRVNEWYFPHIPRAATLVCFLLLTSHIHCHSFAYIFSATQSLSHAKTLHPPSTCRNFSQNSGPGLNVTSSNNASCGPSPIKYILLYCPPHVPLLSLHSASCYIL